MRQNNPYSAYEKAKKKLPLMGVAKHEKKP